MGASSARRVNPPKRAYSTSVVADFAREYARPAVAGAGAPPAEARPQTVVRCTPGGCAHDRRQDGRPGTAVLHPAPDVPGGDPDAAARRADPRQGPAARPRLQDAQHELPGHRHGAALRLDDRAYPRGATALAWHRSPRPCVGRTPADLGAAMSK